MSLRISELREAYRAGKTTPIAVIEGVLARMSASDPAWIVRVDAIRLREVAAGLPARLAGVGGDWSRLPLYGVPFAIKDNIDCAGLDTTAGCPDFAYRPASDAAAVAALLDAGAILVGKTNLDQFATGLVGTRSPYGAVPNTFRPEFISGGSSSGSASVVARGLVSFALGTDTAGSGRVPAAFNNIVGLKPTRGRISTRGVVPACRTLDCISVFALTAADASQVLAVAGAFDPLDPQGRADRVAMRALPARPRIGIPSGPNFLGDRLQEAAWQSALRVAGELGACLVTVDLGPFQEAARLLYEGPWVAERFAAIEAVMRDTPEIVDPVVREVVGAGTRYSAVDAFKARYRLDELRLATASTWEDVDVLLVPGAPTIYRIDEIRERPIERNSHLGMYTNFVNLLDLAAIALPAAMREDGLPFGVTCIAPAGSDEALCRFGEHWQAASGLKLGATQEAAPQPCRDAGVAAGHVRLAVVGAHLSGMPLNHQLTERGAVFVTATRSAPVYRLYALEGAVPAKPGMVRDERDGAAIDLELWDMPVGRFGDFVAMVPAPLCIGSVALSDGTHVKGFLCEAAGLEGARDITSHGGWRAWTAHSR